jgi:hypothetical protein
MPVTVPVAAESRRSWIRLRDTDATVAWVLVAIPVTFAPAKLDERVRTTFSSTVAFVVPLAMGSPALMPITFTGPRRRLIVFETTFIVFELPRVVGVLTKIPVTPTVAVEVRSLTVFDVNVAEGVAPFTRIPVMPPPVSKSVIVLVEMVGAGPLFTTMPVSDPVPPVQLLHVLFWIVLVAASRLLTHVPELVPLSVTFEKLLSLAFSWGVADAWAMATVKANIVPLAPSRLYVPTIELLLIVWVPTGMDVSAAFWTRMSAVVPVVFTERFVNVLSLIVSEENVPACALM